jgi:hypothetical protein
MQRGMCCFSQADVQAQCCMHKGIAMREFGLSKWHLCADRAMV